MTSRRRAWRTTPAQLWCRTTRGGRHDPPRARHIDPSGERLDLPLGQPGVDAGTRRRPQRRQQQTDGKDGHVVPGDTGPTGDESTVERAANDVAAPASQAWRGSTRRADAASRGTPANDSAAQDTSNATEDLAERSETTEPG